MKVKYRQLFLKDLKKLKKQPIYKQVYDLAFNIIPQIESLQEIKAVVPLPFLPLPFNLFSSTFCKKALAV